MIRRRTLLIICGCLAHASACTADPQHYVITMQRVSFSPAVVTVHVGDTLEWRNGDIVAHTATSKEAGFDVNVLPGRSGRAVMERVGEFQYTCRYHPNMKARVVVQGN